MTLIVSSSSRSPTVELATSGQNGMMMWLQDVFCPCSLRSPFYGRHTNFNFTYLLTYMLELAWLAVQIQLYCPTLSGYVEAYWQVLLFVKDLTIWTECYQQLCHSCPEMGVRKNGILECTECGSVFALLIPSPPNLIGRLS